MSTENYHAHLETKRVRIYEEIKSFEPNYSLLIQKQLLENTGKMYKRGTIVNVLTGAKPWSSPIMKAAKDVIAELKKEFQL